MLLRIPALDVGHLQGARKFVTSAAHASAYVVENSQHEHEIPKI
jgi:hypothetical protein